MENDYVLEVMNVTKDYGDFKLDRVSFAVPVGTVCGFIGQNGAGKTTTIQLILDLIARDSGEIRLFGQDVVPGRSYALREDIGVVFDEMGFHEFLTPMQINAINTIRTSTVCPRFFDYFLAVLGSAAWEIALRISVSDMTFFIL